MAIETNIDEDKGKETMDSEEEKNIERVGKLYHEEELMSSSREIKKLRKNNLKQKEKLEKYEEKDCESEAKISKRLE